MIKYLCWQLATIIHWIHYDMNCCHLELTMDNIILQNVKFISNQDGTVSINQSIMIKICDFGLAEVFKDGQFKCDKHGITDSLLYSAPKVFSGDIYDARCADMWSFGILLFYMNTGIHPYQYPDYDTDFGYQCIVDKDILKYVEMKNLSSFVGSKLSKLLNGLLDQNEETRFDSVQILQSKYFR
eukprot:274693_1